MVIVLILLICVAVSNPIKETHQKKLISKFNEEHPILGVLQGGDVLSNLVEYENYVFFSKTKIHNKTLSVGYLTTVKVYTTRVDLLRHLIQSTLQKQLDKIRQNE